MAMFRNGAGAAVALLVLLAMVFQSQAQTCPSATSMISCQAAVTTVNTMPTQACCNKVKSVLDLGSVGPKCLCDAMTSPTAVAFKVIKSQAVLLPSKCQKLMGLQYSKGYNCAGAIVP
ncbi:hypothetical protein M758_3G129500 [Ceratodon purpureus]|nr:hypothetical protein M758_3G129500 [Ceratodon purpureus]